MTLKKPTPEQQEAILNIDHPVCILSGAGCGKTQVLASHFLALILKEKFKTCEIVAATFTDKAASELRERIEDLIQKARFHGTEAVFGYSSKWVAADFDWILEELTFSPITTLHSLATRILRESALFIHLDPSFQVMDENEAALLSHEALEKNLGRILKEKNDDLKTLIRAYGWSNLKEQLLAMLKNWLDWKEFPDDALSQAGTQVEKELWESLNRIFRSTLQTYSELKKEKQGLDFKDLEDKAIFLLSHFPHIRAHYQKIWKAFLVDEFQDTNAAQEKLLKLLLGLPLDKNESADGAEKINVSEALIAPGKHLAIVGDPKQSIYGFRGAKPHIFEHFQKLIENSGGKTVYLTQNFRSPNCQIDWVNSFFRNLFLDYVPLHSEKNEGGIERLWVEELEEEITSKKNRGEKSKKTLGAEEKRQREADAMALRVQSLIREGFSPNEIYFCFRTLNPASTYRQALRRTGITSRIQKGDSLLARQEILDLIHALKLIAKPDDALAAIGILRSPLAGVPDEELMAFAFQKHREETWHSLHPFTEWLKTLSAKTSPYLLLKEILYRTGLVTLYETESFLAEKAGNILQFLNLTQEWETKNHGALEEYLHYLQMLQTQTDRIKPFSDFSHTGPSVTFMTIHQTKGLDLPIVFLPDLSYRDSNNSLPIAQALEKIPALYLPKPYTGLKVQKEESGILKEWKVRKKITDEEEARRVFYVATTRATQKLIFGFLPEENEKSESYRNHLRKHLLPIWNPDAAEKEQNEASESTLLFSAQTEDFENRTKTKQADLYSFRLHQTDFSVTQLECFIRSPKDFFSRYRSFLPVEARPQKKNSSTDLSSALNAENIDPIEKGIFLHQFLYELSQSKSEKDLHRLLDRSNDFLPDRALDENARQILIRSIQRTLEDETFRKILQAEDGYSEIPFLLSYPPYRLRGAMDRLIRLDDDWVVIDYKTHTHVGRENLNILAHDFEFQIKTYCLAASKMLNHPVLKAQLYFVLANLKYDFDFDQKQLFEHETYLKRVMEDCCSL